MMGENMVKAETPQKIMRFFGCILLVFMSEDQLAKYRISDKLMLGVLKTNPICLRNSFSEKE